MQAFITAADPNPSIFGLTIDKKVDAGAFFAFLTIVAGFITWIYKTMKEWRRDARKVAETGALRLLMKILRERYAQDRGPIALQDLRREFESPRRKAERKAYCGHEFRFKDDPHFESAIYELQWESKIDFTADDRILFRTTPATRWEPLPQLHAQIPPDVVLSNFRAALDDNSLQSYDLEALGRLAAAVKPTEAREAIESAVQHADKDTTRLRELLALVSRLSQ